MSKNSAVNVIFETIKTNEIKFVFASTTKTELLHLKHISSLPSRGNSD